MILPPDGRYIKCRVVFMHNQHTQGNGNWVFWYQFGNFVTWSVNGHIKRFLGCWLVAKDIDCLFWFIINAKVSRFWADMSQEYWSESNLQQLLHGMFYRSSVNLVIFRDPPHYYITRLIHIQKSKGRDG